MSLGQATLDHHAFEVFAISVEKRWAAIRFQVRDGLQINSANSALVSSKSLVTKHPVNP